MRKSEKNICRGGTSMLTMDGDDGEMPCSYSLNVVDYQYE
jgi:hypothetical protein